VASPRKKWATSLSPASRTTYPSQAAAYRAVRRYVHEYAAGMLRRDISAVNVWVDERDGRGWRHYERVDLYGTNEPIVCNCLTCAVGGWPYPCRKVAR
jgi:hypothetical protein